jgi:hypothetical protein
MALVQAIKQLQQDKKRLQDELQRISNALKALNSLGANGRRRRKAANGRRTTGRKMSVAGRRAIARAQRARWAKLKSQKAIR